METKSIEVIRGLDPYKPGEEQKFKTACMRRYKSLFDWKSFEIENETKEPGFPDTLEFHGPYKQTVVGSRFVEYKVSDENGWIEFEPAQPVFYKRNASLPIKVRAYSVPDKLGFVFDAADIVSIVAKHAKDGAKSPRKVRIVGGILA